MRAFIMLLSGSDGNLNDLHPATWRVVLVALLLLAASCAVYTHANWEGTPPKWEPGCEQADPPTCGE